MAKKISLGWVSYRCIRVGLVKSDRKRFRHDADGAPLRERRENKRNGSTCWPCLCTHRARAMLENLFTHTYEWHCTNNLAEWVSFAPVIKWECQTDLSISFVTQDKIQWWIIYNSFFTPVLNFNEEPKKEESSGKVVFRFQCKTCQKGYSTDSSTAHNLKLHLKVNLF